MTLLLPAPKRNILQRLHSKWSEMSKRKRYAVASIVDLSLIIMIIVTGFQPASQLISPFVSSINNQLAHAKLTKEVFSFAPGSASNKFSKIDFEGLNILSFFDVPVTAEGDLDTDTRGYYSFKSEESQRLFEEARFNKTKVLLTLTQVKDNSIKQILDSSEAQNKVIEQAVQEVKDSGIDGITVDFEFRGNGASYKDKYSDFIYQFTQVLHREVPNSQLAVAIPSSASGTGLYDLKELSGAADKVLVIAYDFIVPETTNQGPKSPVYGYEDGEYWKNISVTMNDFFKDISSEKLVMERAWYGNGDQYPLYVPTTQPPQEEEKEPSHVILDSDSVERLVANVPAQARAQARKNIPLIGKALENEGILDSNVLAYALATIEHETAETFEPLEEYSGRLSARRLGYEGGTNYFGRGFIQLTHLRNYKVMGQRIGMGDQLVKHPELASSPEVSAKILAAFFKDNNIANLASRGNFIAARMPVNPDRHGWTVASLAWKYGL